MKIYLDKEDFTVWVFKDDKKYIQRYSLKVSEKDFDKLNKILNQIHEYEFLLEVLNENLVNKLKKILTIN